MISLFDTKPEGEETPMFRKVYLSRLHEIAHGPEAQETTDEIASAAYAPLTVTETLPPEEEAAPAISEQTPEPEPEAKPVPVVRLEEPTAPLANTPVASQENSRQVAEDIAPKFVGAFAEMLDELRQRVSAPEGRITEMVESVQAELATLRSAVEALTASQRELSVHVSDIGARLRVHEQAYRNVETMVRETEQGIASKQESLEGRVAADSAKLAEINERLDGQATAIRKLYDVSRDRDGQRDELRSALLKIEEITTRLSPSDPLPEKL
ncbi:MAG: hypothetical protein ABFD60_06075 [Bryobacteraceae bacterium]